MGAYRLLAPLGEGGMGVVHLAQGPDGRRVALKVLRSHVVGDREARERLAREVSSLRRISSPRIAEIVDADPHGPVPFVVTRYVPGLSLYHHVAEEGPIGGADLLHFADALAEAMQAVHAVGVLHRDIKPTNVLMEGRSPVLIDFGLARVAEDARLTQAGWLLGTPGYLAPEILYGDDATVASDVHAWAATVAFAATGKPPYGTGPSMAVMDRVRRGEHDLSGVPDLLQPLVRQGLSPEPLERPSVHELRAALRDLRQRTHLAAGRGAIPGPEPEPEPEPWTMPYAPQAVPTHVPDETPTVGTPREEVPASEATPLSADRTEVRAREATPYQQPAPPAQPSTDPAPPTVVIPPAVAPEPRPVSSPPAQSWGAPAWAPAAPAPQPSRSQQTLQLLGLGALAGAMVAWAPYAGTALVALVVLVLRTASVTRQRHGRRRLLRGRARWYDVPTTTLSTPGYLLLALIGTFMLIGSAAFTGLAMFSLAYLLGQSVTAGLVLAGAGFVPVLWWGPGSSRVREVARGLVLRTSRSEYAGWFVVALGVLGAAVMLGLLFSEGPNWAPAASAPWR